MGAVADGSRVVAAASSSSDGSLLCTWLLPPGVRSGVRQDRGSGGRSNV
jgi:hypothetical protein